MITSAGSRASASSSRSAAMPSASRPSPCSGCDRRTLSKRRISTSSSASTNSTRGEKPRSLQRPDRAGQVDGERPAAHVEHHRGVPGRAAGLEGQLGHVEQQRLRQVVHHVEADVLQGPGDGAAATAGNSGDDHQIGIGRAGGARSGHGRCLDAGAWPRRSARLRWRTSRRARVRPGTSSAGHDLGGHDDRPAARRAGPSRLSSTDPPRTADDAGQPYGAVGASPARAVQRGRRSPRPCAGRCPAPRRSPRRWRRRSRFTEPKRRSSALRRISPSPGTPSSADAVIRFDRRCRWNVMANRCASSRTRCSR